MSKRNVASVRAGHVRSRTESGKGSGKSAYAKKLASGRQMYGGAGIYSCCAHRIHLRGAA